MQIRMKKPLQMGVQHWRHMTPLWIFPVHLLLQRGLSRETQNQTHLTLPAPLMSSGVGVVPATLLVWAGSLCQLAGWRQNCQVDFSSLLLCQERPEMIMFSQVKKQQHWFPATLQTKGATARPRGTTLLSVLSKEEWTNLHVGVHVWLPARMNIMQCEEGDKYVKWRSRSLTHHSVAGDSRKAALITNVFSRQNVKPQWAALLKDSKQNTAFLFTSCPVIISSSSEQEKLWYLNRKWKHTEATAE